MSSPPPLVPRQVQDLVLESLGAFRCVVLHGPRQAGKTTLTRLVAERIGANYRTMDKEEERTAAAADPDGYVAAVGTPLVIDEVQRVGEPLVLAVKAAVDLDRRPGQFLLTGSSNFLTVPTISETLAGRVDIIELWPLAQRELAAGSGSFVDSLFDGGIEGLLASTASPADRPHYFEVACRGGFPEVQAMTGRSRRRWFTGYLETVLDREVATAADIRHRETLEAMMRLLASTTAQELVMTNLARRLGVGRDLAERYEPWLERVFLVDRVPGWGRGLTSKLVRRPKIYAVDTGLAAALIGRDATALAQPTEPFAGPLIETLAASEIRRQLTWTLTEAHLHHLRDSDGSEVHLVIDSVDGRVAGVEVKATTAARIEDFKGLAWLRDRLDRAGVPFVAGIVLHTGVRRLPFGDRLAALPLSDLWS